MSSWYAGACNYHGYYNIKTAVVPVVRIIVVAVFMSVQYQNENISQPEPRDGTVGQKWVGCGFAPTRGALGGIFVVAIWLYMVLDKVYLVLDKKTLGIRRTHIGCSPKKEGKKKTLEQ